MITCVLVSNNKPQFCKEAIYSVTSQTHQDWELVVIDSGILFDNGYFDQFKDERIKIIRSNETEDQRRYICIASWCFNECYRRNLVRGSLVTYLCDDDIYYSNAFSTFHTYSQNIECDAWYGSIDLAIHLGETPVLCGSRLAFEIGGKNAYKMDCRVDGLQFCHRKSVLDNLDEYWPEDIKHKKNADGIFMDRIGKFCYIYPIPIKIGQNRRTKESINYKL